ncbi:MAG: iron chaperone [Flavobacteriia bacterium]|jgi:uncharacterized protein YdhG (YjbR/CyaY superfamily)
MEKSTFNNVDAYIAHFDAPRQEILETIRVIIKKNAPEAEEKISYGMPAYKLNGALVYFAIYEKHLGLYPTGTSLAEFAEELKKFKTSKGAIQFQLKEEIPYDLIERIVQFRVKQNLEKPKK